MATYDRSELRSGDISITIAKLQQATVVVTGPDGAPMPDVRVSLGGMTMEHVVRVPKPPVKTDARGEAVLDCLYKGGTYYVGASAEGLVAPSITTPPVGGNGWTGRIEIRLEPPTRKQMGRVVDETGAPVADAVVVALITGDPSAKTDSDGRFVIQGLPDSAVRLRVYAMRLCGEASVNKDTPDVVITVAESPSGGC